jgi:phosphate transport system permease protein
MTALARSVRGKPRPSLFGSTATPRWHRVVEHAIAAVAFVSVAAVLSILAFVAREAAPMFWEGREHLADLIWPREWPGYDAPAHVWQPVGFPPKHDVVPLLIGTLKITGLAMLVAGPIGLLSAVYVAELAPRRVREVVKPAIELFAGIPSVVLGFFSLVFIAHFLERLFGLTYRLNALVAALGLALTIVPVVFTVSEDALRAVPKSLREASAALGARRWQTTLRVVVPAALPGIAAAFVLGFGRAIGETMIVLMASGNAPVVDASPVSSARTVTATIAAELGETARGGEHWRVLFALGVLLFLITWALDRIGASAVARLRRRLHGPEAEP